MSSVELRRVLFVFLSPYNKAAAQKTDGAESIQLKLMESGYPHKSLRRKSRDSFFQCVAYKIYVVCKGI